MMEHFVTLHCALLRYVHSYTLSRQCFQEITRLTLPPFLSHPSSKPTSLSHTLVLSVTLCTFQNYLPLTHKVLVHSLHQAHLSRPHTTPLTHSVPSPVPLSFLSDSRLSGNCQVVSRSENRSGMAAALSDPSSLLPPRHPYHPPPRKICSNLFLPAFYVSHC
jgi:hypothetical protein